MNEVKYFEVESGHAAEVLINQFSNKEKVFATQLIPIVKDGNTIGIGVFVWFNKESNESEFNSNIIGDYEQAKIDKITRQESNAKKPVKMASQKQLDYMVNNHNIYKGVLTLDSMENKETSPLEYLITLIKETRIVTPKDIDIIDFVIKNPSTSILKISQALNMDYKNMYQRIEVLISKQVLIENNKSSESENQKGKARLISISPDYVNLLEDSFSRILEVLKKKIKSNSTNSKLTGEGAESP